MAQNLGEGVVVIDDDGLIRFMNRAACTLLGYQEEEVMKTSFHKLVHPEETEEQSDFCVLHRGLESGASIRFHDEGFRRSDGTSLVVAVTITRVAEAGSEGSNRTVIVFRDMQEYELMQRRLLSTDRMHAVSNLATGIAHEINNPLAYLQSNVRFVHRALQRRKDQQADSITEEMMVEALEDAMEGIGRITAIVAGMRAFTGNRDVVEDVDVWECLQDALQVCKGSLKRNAKVEVRGGRGGFTKANRSRLTQVFVNLLLNAVAAIEEANLGVGEIFLDLRTFGMEVVVEISDSGVGISQELQKQIFDPFFTTREVGDGTGLGLYICRSILMEMGAEIAVLSAPGEGACFQVTLPRTHPVEEAGS